MNCHGAVTGITEAFKCDVYIHIAEPVSSKKYGITS
jgi:hypothetical protein